MNISITDNGGILINETIICDGYDPRASLRVQSHIHTDHLREFGSSKQDHNIVMNIASKEYLSIGKNNLDIAKRPGIKGLQYNEPYYHEGYAVRLLNNSHILGSSQIEIIAPDGESFGYSGDFYFPVEDVIHVDNLVIDGSCGGVFCIRSFTRDDAINALDEKLSELLFKGPVYVKAHKGLLEKIFFWTNGIRGNVPRIASQDFIDSLVLHERYNYGTVINTYEKNSEEGVAIIRSGDPYIQFVHSKEQVFNIESKQVIECTRFNDSMVHPLREVSSRSFQISFSDHADIDGTLEYIQLVSPNEVYIDGTRTGKRSSDLANVIQNRLNIIASVLRPE